MTDSMTVAQRSACMARIRARDTGPELKLRSALWTLGFRFRVRSKLPGKPDIVFSRRKVVIFVDGCFWHGCPIHGRSPKSNRSYWLPKIERNVARDASVTALLQDSGWTVCRVWEHELKNSFDAVVVEIAAVLKE